MKISPLAFATTGGVLLLTLLFPAQCAPAADADGQWNVQPVALMVVAPDGGKGNRSFSWKPGVTVSALVAPPGGNIIQLDGSTSKVTSFTDDKGTDLMAAPASDDPFNKPGLSYMSPPPDEKSATTIVDLKAPGLPAKGATALNISGQITAEIAGDSKQVTVADAEFKPGTVFNLGGMPVKISKASVVTNSYERGSHFSVTFNCASNLECISSIEFFDPQGNKINAHKSSWGGGDFFGYMAEYELKQPLIRGKIVVNYWTDLKTVTMPFTIKTGLGL